MPAVGVVLVGSLVALVPAWQGHAEVVGPTVTRAEAGLSIAAGYTAPERVEGTGVDGQAVFAPSDRAGVFLWVDVRAVKGNKNGFGAGEFIPYLSVSYAVRSQAGGEAQRGRLHALVGRQGLRYGNNVPITVPGRYTVVLTVEPPVKVGFGRHTDIETGVSRWWPPVQAEWTFDVARVAKP
jgi:uncharacterized protein involved in high-affinity Fe2+ transport